MLSNTDTYLKLAIKILMNFSEIISQVPVSRCVQICVKLYQLTDCIFMFYVLRKRGGIWKKPRKHISLNFISSKCCQTVLIIFIGRKRNAEHVKQIRIFDQTRKAGVRPAICQHIFFLRHTIWIYFFCHGLAFLLHTTNTHARVHLTHVWLCKWKWFMVYQTLCLSGFPMCVYNAACLCHASWESTKNLWQHEMRWIRCRMLTISKDTKEESDDKI